MPWPEAAWKALPYGLSAAWGTGGGRATAAGEWLTRGDCGTAWNGAAGT
jgi:hypothetical protein